MVTELDTTESARILGVSDGTVRELCHAGTLKARKGPPIAYHPAGTWFITRGAIEEYLRNKNKPVCKPLSDIDKGYIAGLLDGEGCLTSFTTKVQGGRYWNTKYFIQIIVRQEEPIRWLREVTGIGYVFRRDRQKQGWQDLWGWRVTGRYSCEVLEQILPYLKIKHRQAEIFLQLRDVVKAGKAFRKGKNGAISRPLEEWRERQKLIDEIHLLNGRTGKRRRMEFTNVK